MSYANACLVSIAALLAGLPAVQAQDRKPSGQEMAQIVQLRTAELRRTQTAEKMHLEKLSAPFRAAPTGPSGGNEQQQKLRDSIARSGPALQRSLARVDCRDRQCALEFKLSQAASGPARARELFAIDEWAATSQACAFTMVDEPADGGPVRVFIDCAP